MAKTQEAMELLIKKGLITRDQIERAREEVKKTGLPLEKALEKLGYITEEEIASTIADTLDIPYIDLTDYIIDQEVIKLVPETLAKKHKAVPLFKIGNALTLAMVDPQDIIAIDEIRLKAKIDSVDTVLVSERGIQKVLDSYYGVIGTVDELIKDIDKAKFETKAKGGLKDISEVAGEPPIIKLVNLMITQAVKDRASDIHIEPDDTAVRIRYRIDGILHEINVIPKHLQSAVISRIKILAKMDIAEQRKPQDGRIKLKKEDRDIDIRVSSFPTIHGENVVMRLLDKSTALLGLPELGLSKGDLKKFEKLIHQPNGIILVTGPTGSGKTTTLYGALSTINSMEKNIITIEDPVEYELPLIRQTQVNPKAGLTFAAGLRSILRQDPDVVMVGEIRDKETADISIQAALTGHLVFSTLHTNDAPSALARLLDMGVEPFLISSSVMGILGQRLVRAVCPKCKENHTPSDEVLKDLGLKGKMIFYRGKGCASCRGTGFAGRIGIFELLIMDEDIRKLIVAKASADEIRKIAISKGMGTLFSDGISKAKEGITTVEEVLRVTKTEEE
ncbi:MAG: type II secretion system protein GspE [Candidatus Omnitrophica bacterium CG07_land_8_20_14_0_80_42_15]|uniref:Type II secretion system protein GspE n=1 Tax=Candidatus Aquitaenariimonas noxiae TaxID=1974741 RepID=A0A2J0KWS2_9BACT|nr:MAG: type II secretion system protein GspE [Candidatus Omnitrophica bacterium CG07_land_8_20_14_0_80_42_15]